MEDRAAVWTLVGVVVGLKAWAVLLILLNQPSSRAVVFLLAMNWPLVLLAAAMLGASAAVWLRLLRARARRRILLRQEWDLESGEKVR